MRIQSLEVSDYPPLKYLKIENLGNTVIIAGANGSGKTRLKTAIVQTLQGSPQANIILAATREEERTKYFKNDLLEVKKGVTNSDLTNYITSRHYGRGKYVGSLVQIDSQRELHTIKYTKPNWFAKNPDESETPSHYYCTPFVNRWQNFMTYIHQKHASRDRELVDAVKKDPSRKGDDIIQENPDPLEKYKKIFSNVLPGKELQDINPESPRDFQYKDATGASLPFSSLSGGEQEVIKIIFDVARNDIRHSIIIVDEPELHLHPALTFSLIETLKNMGDRSNQLILLTHSADLISTYYSTGDVYFIDTIQSGANQAHKLSELNHSHRELTQLIGENLGLFAVGKKLIFVEGENSSVDRLAYHSIAQKYLPDVKFAQIGSVENIMTLNAVETQIRSSIFGIDFYMIRDRDGLSEKQINLLEANGRIKCLKKKHIENYFLDPEILFKVVDRFCLNIASPQLTQAFIESEIKRVATDFLKLNVLQNTKEYLKANYRFNIPTVKSLDEKDINAIKTEMLTGVTESLVQLSDKQFAVKVGQWMDNEKARLEELIANGQWINEFRGKEIFSILCGNVLKDDSLRVRQAYVDIALEEKPIVFQDIIDILSAFR